MHEALFILEDYFFKAGACKESMNLGLFAYLTFLWAQVANIAGFVH